MDKAEFIKQATRYYALAIAWALQTSSGSLTDFAIQKQHTVLLNFEDEVRKSLLGNEWLWDEALSWLTEMQAIKIRKPTFGPSLLAKGESFQEFWKTVRLDTDPFNFIVDVEDQQAWLRDALMELDTVYENLEISADDFEGELSDGWAPIQLDVSAPEYKNAIEKLDQAIAEISANNGYAENMPEEREFVISGLVQGREKLKTGTISANFLRDVWEKLSIVGRRFSGSALEITILGAKQALTEFVRQQGAELLRHLTKLISGG